MMFNVFIRLFLNLIKTIIFKQIIFSLYELIFFIYLLIMAQIVSLSWITKILKMGPIIHY